jgi:hypothetical protein
MRYVAPSFFAMLGVPLLDGRDFIADDRRSGNDQRERVAIVSQSVAQRLFPNGEAVNRKLLWTDPVLNMGGPQKPRRIVGVVADMDDENIVPGPTMTVYLPAFEFGGLTERLFVHTSADPYALVPAVTRIIRELSPEQPVERAATLEDVRAQVLAPERVNAFVLSGFASVALLIAVVGVAGVLAFSVNARTREFGVRLALGSTPRQLTSHVLLEGVIIAAIGIGAGAAGAYLFRDLASSYVGTVSLPGVLPLAGSAAILATAAIVASLMPAVRAARVDVLQVLRSE